MQHLKTNTVIKEFIDGYTCDKCGKKMSYEGTWSDDLELQEWFHYSFTGGFGSIFGDMMSYRVDLCQECMRDTIGPYLKEIGDDYAG